MGRFSKKRPPEVISDEWDDSDNAKHIKSITSRRSRAKGLGFERDVANVFKEVFKDARRHLEFQKDEAVGVDLKNVGQFLVQCKAFKKYAPITCIKEIQERKGYKPVLITRGKGREYPPVAVLYFSDFMELVRRLESKSDGA